MNVKLIINNLFSTVVTVAILAITILIMTVSVIIGGFYAAYNFMLSNGINSAIASSSILFFAVILLFIAIILIIKYMEKLVRPNWYEGMIKWFYDSLNMDKDPRI